MLEDSKLALDWESIPGADLDGHVAMSSADVLSATEKQNPKGTRREHLHKVSAEPGSGIRTVAKLTDDLVSRVEDFPHSHGVECLRIIPRQSLFFDTLRGVERLEASCRGWTRRRRWSRSAGDEACKSAAQVADTEHSGWSETWSGGMNLGEDSGRFNFNLCTRLVGLKHRIGASTGRKRTD